LTLGHWTAEGRDTYGDATIVADGISRAQLTEIPDLVKAAARDGAELRAPLEQFFADEGQSGEVRRGACRALAALYADDPKSLVRLLTEAADPQHSLLVEALGKHSHAAELLLERLEEEARLWSQSDAAGRNPLAQQQVNVLCALLQLGGADSVWPRLAHRADPRVQTYFIHTAAAKGVPAELLARRLQSEQNPGVLYALILALDGYSSDAFEQQRFRMHVAELLKKYEHPDSGVHSAARWLLTRWGEGPQLRRINERLHKAPIGGYNWYINRVGQTMVLVRGIDEEGKPVAITAAEASDGSPGDWNKVRWTFAIATTETTWEELRKWPGLVTKDLGPEQSGNKPAGISMPEFFAYCRWLGEHEVADDAQAIRNSDSAGKYVVDVRAQGYRMPLDIEWQQAVRAGTSTSRFFGEATDQLAAMYVQGLAGGARPADAATKMPNQLGLFDPLGNVYEWTLDEVNDRFELITGHDQFERRIEILGLLENGTRLRVRGGSFRQPETSSNPDSAISYLAQAHRIEFIGFRVGRTINMPTPLQYAPTGKPSAAVQTNHLAR
jgi:formylglycine-generating enzyme required for sulfatase activity